MTQSAEVTYARPEHQWLVKVEIAPETTVRQAVEASGLMPVAERYDRL